MRQLLPYFQKPGYYAGIEDGISLKNPAEISLKIALAFPDTYDVGMSYLGHKILYSIINNRPHWQAERVMAPDVAASKLLIETNTPLASIETATPLNKFAAIGFAVTHELCYADLLRMLDLAAIPVRQSNRPDDLFSCPVIMAGGGALLGAEPLSPFLDLALLGDGEELLPEVLKLLEDARIQKLPRSAFLLRAAEIPGVYVPSLFKQNPDGSLEALIPDYRPARRIVADINQTPYPTQQICPVGAVHNRLALEIARGCTRGCRFCHAGMVYRPYRERNPEQLKNLLDECLDKTGFEEISFLALSAGDYSALNSLWNLTFERCAQEQITMALPSLRVGSVDDNIMAKMATLRRSGCTLAPEAGSQRLRDVINKGITEEELINHATSLLKYGWRQVKLYFMIGLPTESDEDLLAIIDLCRKTRDAGGRGQPRLAVTASISPFVPKPFTPFQWEAQLDIDEFQRRINLLLNNFKHEKLLTLRWHDPRTSYLEGILSRGDRRLAGVIEKAVQNGAIFCSWKEHFDLQVWLDALADEGYDPRDLIKARDINAPLPWSHLEAGVSKDFLLRERARAYKGITTSDCRFGQCQLCGSCDHPGMSSLLPHTDESSHVHRLVYQQRDQQPISPLSQNEIHKEASLPRINPLLAQRHSSYRIWHVKLGNFAFLSQLELQSVISRALRRAKLPIAFSQGFHPLPLLSFGRAMPVGAQSHAEWFSVTFHSYLAPQKILAGLNIFLQRDLGIKLVELIEKKQKTQQAISENFKLQFINEEVAAKAGEAFSDFSALPEYYFQRTTKKGIRTDDIRPLLLKWQLQGQDIAFTTDWSREYLSPIQFAQAIINIKNLDLTKNAILIKTGQIFENGTHYPEHFKNWKY